MPRAWSWSMAITSPPASGCVARARPAAARGPGRARRQPLALQRQRGAQPLAGRGRRRAASSKVAEWTVPSGADPLHLAVRAREVDGPHDAAVGERVAVAVLVVGARPRRSRRSARTGSRRVSERNGVPDSASRRPAPAKATRIASPQARSSPAWWSSSKHHERVARRAAPARSALRRDLLVGDDDAVHVGRQAPVAGRPRGLEVQVEAAAAARAHWSLRCCGRRHDDQPAARAARRGAAARR